MSTPEKILDELLKYKEHGVISYVVTTKPLGQQWVIGIEGQIVKLDTPQAIAWLTGAGAVARFIARRQGLAL